MTTSQPSLFDVLRAPPVVLSGPLEDCVVKGEIDEHLFLPHPRMAWHQAEIKLHRHTNGLWMWSTATSRGGAGWGYHVGPKWNNFAESRDDALFYAVQEIQEKVQGSVHKQPSDAAILAWLETLV